MECGLLAGEYHWKLPLLAVPSVTIFHQRTVQWDVRKLSSVIILLDFDEIADEFEFADKPPMPAFGNVDLAEGFANRPLFVQVTLRRPALSSGRGLICVRRTRKSFILALVVVFLTIFRDWSEYLYPASAIRPVASGRKQARMRSEGQAVVSLRWGAENGEPGWLPLSSR